MPYFHTKINITGVKLWSKNCAELYNENTLSTVQQLIKCNVDNKPFSDCTFKNVKLEAIDNYRKQITQAGLSDTDKDGLTFHGVHLSVFISESNCSNSFPIFVRNILDLERQ